MPVTEESFQSLTGGRRQGFLQDLSKKLAFGHSARGAAFSEIRVVKATRETYSSDGDHVSYSHTSAHSSSEVQFDPRRQSYPTSSTSVSKTEFSRASYSAESTEEPIEDFYIVKRDYFSNDPDGLSLFKGQLVEVLDSSGGKQKTQDESDFDFDLSRSELLFDSAAQHKRAIRPRKTHADSRQRPVVEEPDEELKYLVRTRFNTCGGQRAWIPANLLEKQCKDPEEIRRFSIRKNIDEIEEAFATVSKKKENTSELVALRSAIAKELVETEEEFCSDLRYVVDNYLKHMDLATTPKEIREMKEPLFGNFKEISEFHNSVLIEGLKYYAEEHPNQIGKAFLRLERDFDQHTRYCQSEQEAQKLLAVNEQVRRYFEDYGASIDDDKSLTEHLKLPVQRINDYKFLVEDLIVQTSNLNEETEDLQNALDLIHRIPHQAQDAELINNIEGYRGNIKQLGSLLRNDTFTVTDKAGNSEERVVLLFRSKILVCEKREKPADQKPLILKEIIKLADTELNEVVTNTKSFQLKSNHPGNNHYPINFEADSLTTRNLWVDALKEFFNNFAGIHGELDDDLEVVPASRDTETEKRKTTEEKIQNKKLKQEYEESFKSIDVRGEEVIKSESLGKRKTEVSEAIDTVNKTLKVSEDTISRSESSVKQSSVTGISSADSAKSRSETKISTETEDFLSKQSDLKKASSDGVHIVPTHADLETAIPVTVERKSSSQERKYSGTDVIAKSEHSKTSAEGSFVERKRSLKTESQSFDQTSIVEGIQSIESGATSRKSSRTEQSTKFTDRSGDCTSETVSENRKKSLVSDQELNRRDSLKTSQRDTVLSSREESARKQSIATESCDQQESLSGAVKSVKSTDFDPQNTPQAGNSVNDKESGNVRLIPIETCVETGSETNSVKEEILTGLSGAKLKRESFESRADSLKSLIIEEVSSPNIDDFNLKSPLISEAEDSKVFDLQDEKKHSVRITELEKSASDVTLDSGSTTPVFGESQPLFQQRTKRLDSLQEEQSDISLSIDKSEAKVSRQESEDTVVADTSLLQRKLSTESSTLAAGRKQSQSGSDSKYPVTPESSVEPIPARRVSQTSSDKYLSDLDEKISIRKDSTADKSQIQKESAAEKTSVHKDSKTESLLIKESEVTSISSSKTESYTKKTMDSGEKSKVPEEKAPHFTIKLKDTELVEQGTVTFMLKVKGDPVPELFFFKDDKPVVFTDHVKVIYEDAAKTTAEFIIEHVDNADAGLYKCVAKNEHGEDVSEGRITITKAKDEPEPKKLIEGEAPEFSWYKDGKEFDATERFKVMYQDEDDTLALVFQHVKPEDAGLYTCVASTTSGNISCSAELTVHGGVNHLLRDPEPPSFTMDLTDTEVSMGGSAMLELKLTGFPKPEVTWFKDGEEVKAGGRFRFLYEDEESIALIIKSVKQEDAGEYVVKAKNDLGDASTTGKLLVKAPPKFKNKMKDTACMTDQAAKFEIQVEGTPLPEVKWYKDGQIIIESERIKMTQEKDGTFTLVIERVILEDTGSYSIVASNSLGQMSEFFQMVANSAPSFSDVTKMTDVDVDQNETALFEVKVKGSPAPKVEWLKNGKPLEADGSRVIISGDVSTHSVIYRKTSKHDTGKITCKLTNEYGVKEHSAFLGVKCSPEFIQELKHLETKEGEENVELTVKILAYPQPKIKWYIGDLEINESRTEFKKVEEGDTIKLIMTRVTEQMAETYTCEVENALGKSKSSADVNVAFEPKIIEGMKDYHYDEGTQAVFTVKCKANPKPEVKWYRDSEEVSKDVKIKCIQEGETTYIMKISEIDNSYTGRYEFRAKNTIAEKKTEGKLYVDCKPIIISDTFEDVKSFESQPATVIIEGAARPEPNFKLEKDGVEVSPSDRIVMTVETVDGFNFKYTIHFERTETSDTGTYTFTLSNRLGEAKITRDINIESMTTLNCPKILIPPEDQVSVKKRPVSLSARIAGHPDPEVKWFHGDSRLFNDEETEIKTVLEDQLYTMTIRESLERHRGIYTVKASNEHGQCESSAKVDVKVKPEIDKFCDVQVEPDGKAMFHAKVNANPPAKISWRKGEGILENGGRYQIHNEDDVYYLEISNCTVSDNGKYEIIAVNEVGETVYGKTLTVHAEVPVFVKPLLDTEVKDKGNGSCLIQVKGTPKPALTWFKDGSELTLNERIEIIEETGGMFYTLSFKNFQRADVGRYTVKAKNVGGESESSARVEMESISPRFTRPLEPATHGYEGETLTIVGKVSGSPIPAVKWLKDGKEIVPDDRINIVIDDDGTVKLIIKDAKPEDQGQYSLLAINEHGENKSDTYLAIKARAQKPVFLIPFQDFTVVEGQPCKLTAKIAGCPKPHVKWLKNGMAAWSTDIISMTSSPDGTITLEIEMSTQEHAGKYAAVLVNDIGEAYSECKLTVEPPSNAPSFPEEMKSARCVVGYPARLETKVKGFPLPDIKWESEGKEILNDKQKSRIMYDALKGTTSLMMFDCNFDDSKDYFCVAKNKEGESRSGAKIVVIGKLNEKEPLSAPAFVHPLKDVHLNEGEELRLVAPVVGNPLPEIEWKRNGVTVCPNKEDTFYVFDGVKMGLFIQPVKVKDEGEYECILFNDHGQASSKCFVYVRKVYQPPYFTQRFHDLQQMRTLDAKFMSRITGVPTPDVTWTKDGKPIPLDSEKFKVRRDDDINCLFIRDCTDNDSGLYACVARNIDGEERCEAKLEIVDEIDHSRRPEAPRFLKKIGDCDVYEGMKAKFTACATGWPEPTAEWYKDGVKLFPGPRFLMETEGEGRLLRLVIDNVCSNDVGQYKLVVSNEHGSDQCEGELVYENFEARARKPLADQYPYIDQSHAGIPPPLSDKPIISSMTDHSLVLSWSPSLPFGPRPPVTYVVDMCAMPGGQWSTFRSGLRGLSCDVTNLVPGTDYKFRIRVESSFGTSDPSPYALAFRQKLDFNLPTPDYYLPSNTEFCPNTSHYFPRDFDMDHEKYKHAPRFLSQPSDVQYGIKHMPNNIRWFVYGYPIPKLSWYFNGELIESGGRFDKTFLSNGQATLFINKMLDRDAGVYEAVAVNDYGESRQKVRVAIAEHPHLIQRLTEVIEMPHKTVRFECRISGVPCPEVRWFRDWSPLAPSARVKIFQSEDKYSLMISDVLASDAGLYSCSARNVAGSVTTSGMLYIEGDEEEYHHRNYLRMSNIRPRMISIQDYYDLGDELGRGTQGIVYHAVQRSTGRSYAAKLMMGGEREKSMMLNELEMMNQLNHRNLIRLYDAYESRKSLGLVLELAGGGELLDNITRRAYITEREITIYIRQILWGLEHMHERGFAHLGLKLGDVLVSRYNGQEVKICDFGLTRKIIMTQQTPLDFGMPEYVAPEVANGLGVSFPADMWSLGIITHILLTGISPFRGADDKETLTRLQSGHFTLDEDLFSNISLEARDFIIKLLTFHPDSRMDVRLALRHPWLQMCDLPRDDIKIPTGSLLNYYSTYKDWYRYANCRNWYRRRPLASAFTHPTRMVYPPGEIFTPPETPEREIVKKAHPSFEERIKSEYRCDFGLGQSESHYQYGPDTYLLQLRDVDFPVRLRKYMKVAANRSSEMKIRIHDVPWDDIPVVRERRRYMDIMDEEIDDEKRLRFDQYDTKYSSLPRRLQREIGTRSQAYVDKEALVELKRDGLLPFFREKPQSKAITSEKLIKISCYAVGEPKPTVQWFRNDAVLGDTTRVRVEEDPQGRSLLVFDKTMIYDVGLYKCVARNKNGQTTCRFRLILGDIPSPPDSPEIEDISDTEMLLKWKPPKDDGNSRILSYCLEFQEHADTDWSMIHDNIDHEFYCVRDLRPDTEYHFRLSCRNIFGWSPKGIPSSLKRTKVEGSDKLIISRAMRHLQQITESGLTIMADYEKPQLNYSVEATPIPNVESLPTDNFDFISEISRGKFSVILKCTEKETDKMFVAKVVSKEATKQSRVFEEYNVMKSLCHERIVSLYSFYETNNMFCLIMEKLQGYDVLSYLTSKPEYTEEMVSKVIIQVLDGIQYLHWKGLGYLNLQPDNIILSNSRSLDIKLVDFGACQRVSKFGNLIEAHGNDEYTAPEVLCGEEVMPYADVWSVGVLAYVLLSGVSPFRGATLEETRQNINFVRFRFEHLYNEITTEATRFLMLVFKRQASKRPNVEECLEHRWLLCSEFMLKKREKAVFLNKKLQEYANDYHTKRLQDSTDSETLLNAFGMGLSRSLSHTSDIYNP